MYNHAFKHVTSSLDSETHEGRDHACPNHRSIFNEYIDDGLLIPAYILAGMQSSLPPEKPILLG